MSNGDKSASSRMWTGEVTATGSTIQVQTGFRPAAVEVINKDGLVAMRWNRQMGEGKGYKSGSNSSSARREFSGGDIKGSVTVDVGIASGTLPTNGALLSTLASAANTTNFTIAVSPDRGRNVSISFKNTNVGASTGNAVSCVITGTWRGAAQTETISFTQLELTSTAQNEVATKFGSKPFDTVTSITLPVAQPANWQHAAGVGSKIGLPENLKTPIEADVQKITKNAANLAVTGLVDTTNMTVNLGTLSDGDDFEIVYLVAAGTSSFVSTLGISTGYNSLSIGADTDLNVNGNTLYVTAWSF
jgi:hypothetical protein